MDTLLANLLHQLGEHAHRSSMTDDKRFGELLQEFRRVGVDPDTFSAVLSVSPDDALAALALLEDGAGPAAFLTQLRRQQAPTQ